MALTETKTLHVFRDNNEIDCVIAESAEDAMKVLCEHAGGKPEDYPDTTFEQMPDDQMLTIMWEDKHDIPPGEPEKMRLTCADWVKQEGRSFLCSTEY